MPLLRMWVHCPRASNGLLPRRSNLVGYVRWGARSHRFPPCQTTIPTAFRSQSGWPTIRPEHIPPTGNTSIVSALYLDRIACEVALQIRGALLRGFLGERLLIWGGARGCWQSHLSSASSSDADVPAGGLWPCVSLPLTWGDSLKLNRGHG